MPQYYVSITLLLYLLSLCFDAVSLVGGSHMSALQMLLYGPWGVVFGLFGWFANPLLGLAILSRRRPRLRWLSLLFSVAALYLGLASLGLERLPDNNSYKFLDVSHFGPGYYLWLLALVSFCAGQAWSCRQALRGIEIPRWRLLDIGLACLLNVVVVLATQDSTLHFKVERALEPAPALQSPPLQPDDAI